MASHDAAREELPAIVATMVVLTCASPDAGGGVHRRRMIPAGE